MTNPRTQCLPPREPEVLRIRLFGGFRVSVGARIVGEKGWRLRKAASLVKLLALAREHGLHRELVMDLLWSDLDSKAATNNLHRALHFARRALEPTPASTTSRYLALEGDLLRLCPDGQLWVDVEAFERAAATARQGREPGAYRAAIDLYTGDLLPEDRYERWSEDKRQVLRTSYLALLVELAAIYEEREVLGSAIEALQKVVANERTHEEAHSALMRLYAMKGHSQKALLQYGQLQKALPKTSMRSPMPRAGTSMRRSWPAGPRKPARYAVHRRKALLTRGTICRMRIVASSGGSGSWWKSSERWR